MNLKKPFEDLNWDELTLDWDELTLDWDELMDVRGVDYKTSKHKDLWTVCRQLFIKGEECYLTDHRNLAATRKEPQCPYMLMIILYSDSFAK